MQEHYSTEFLSKTLKLNQTPNFKHPPLKCLKKRAAVKCLFKNLTKCNYVGVNLWALCVTAMCCVLSLVPLAAVTGIEIF